MVMNDWELKFWNGMAIAVAILFAPVILFYEALRDAVRYYGR